MKKITLQFPSIVELLEFSLSIDITNCSIEWKQLTITCVLPEANIELARLAYEAIEIKLAT